MFRTKVVEKIKIHILCSINIFKICTFNEIMCEQYSTTRQTTEENMEHAHCVIDIKGYQHTFTVCNIYCFSTATMFALKRLKYYVICRLLLLVCGWQCCNTLCYSGVCYNERCYNELKNQRTVFF